MQQITLVDVEAAPVAGASGSILSDRSTREIAGNRDGMIEKKWYKTTKDLLRHAR